MTEPLDDARGELLALADARDRAYERLHQLCGTRADAPRWDDIGTLLRERDELYVKLRAAGLREAMESAYDALGIVQLEGIAGPHCLEKVSQAREALDVVLAEIEEIALVPPPSEASLTP